MIAAIKKTTDKPIRYVFDTHHHGDHAYGNAVFAKAGAGIVAQTNCARLLRVNGPKEFEDAGKGPMGRKDVAESKLKVPNVVFDDKLVLDDGKQRVEFLFLGHAHTAGDAVAYLPKHKILCTGDACVNGAFNFMGHSDSASWIRALERMQQLDVKMVCPGHGPLAGKDLLERQKRYFVELRDKVRQGIAAKKNAEEIHKSLDMPWYKEWTGVEPRDGERRARLRRIDGPRRAVGPGGGFRHLRGSLADEGLARLEEAEAHRRAVGPDAGAAGGAEADRAGSRVPAGAGVRKTPPNWSPTPTPCSASPPRPRWSGLGRTCAGFKSVMPASRRNCRRSWYTATSC